MCNPETRGQKSEDRRQTADFGCRSRRFSVLRSLTSGLWPPGSVLCLLFSLALFTAPLPAADALSAARTLLDTERLPEAREPLETFLAAEPQNAEARLLLGRVYIGLGRLADAVATLEPALRATPDTAPLAPRLLAEYGRACLLHASELGFSFRAPSLARRGRDALEKASALAPDNIAYHEGLVEFYRHAPGIAGGSRSKAMAHAQAITRLDAVRGSLHEAALSADEKRFTEALALCDRALAAEPDNYFALYTLGRIAADSGQRTDEGQRALLRCLTMTPTPTEPTRASVYFRLGLLAEKQNQRSQAFDYLKESLRLDPHWGPAQEALKRVQS
ncbi:hypothetical protein OPIT5_05690 [Opitutaceae bacterium TAV5]|nr:hypothetical protein OPIT5_05690 [Opitutaceae bacterium TAV5]